ncbi:MAG: hypothetical protein ACJAWN_002069, partial [Neolewinella sp.]
FRVRKAFPVAIVRTQSAAITTEGSNLVIRSIRVKGPVVFGLLALMRLG